METLDYQRLQCHRSSSVSDNTGVVFVRSICRIVVPPVGRDLFLYTEVSDG